jgi:hypothetical protein
MLIVLILIFVALSMFFIWLAVDNDSDGIWFAAGTSIIASIICIICLLVGIVKISKLQIIDSKIQLCEEENSRIEMQVEATVRQYMEYEQGVIDKIDISQYDGEKLLLISQLYPDLKANELLQYQISLYEKNNTEIKNLKNSKLDNQLWKWWVYFKSVG